MKQNDFDGIAKWYDRLASLVFGDAIKKSQCFFLDELPTEGKVLIIGGGSGWILEEIAQVRPGLIIDYVEASSKMIALSEERMTTATNIRFVHGTEADIPATKYDGIITNFFLDVFEENKLLEVMRLLKMKLRQGGLWLCTDFHKTGKLSHKLLLEAMHLFFGTISNLNAKRLLNFEMEFYKLNFRKSKDKNFYHGMIKTAVYRPI